MATTMSCFSTMSDLCRFPDAMQMEFASSHSFSRGSAGLRMETAMRFIVETLNVDGDVTINAKLCESMEKFQRTFVGCIMKSIFVCLTSAKHESFVRIPWVRQREVKYLLDATRGQRLALPLMFSRYTAINVCFPLGNLHFHLKSFAFLLQD